MPACPVIMFAPTCTVPSLISNPGTPSSNDKSTSWPSASTSESVSSVSNSPVGCGKPFSSSCIFSTVSTPSSMRLMVESHFIMMPSCKRLLDLEVVRRHAIAGAPIDDDRLCRAKALGGARGIDRGVAAAVDDDAPSEQRLVLAFHRAQQRDGVEHL